MNAWGILLHLASTAVAPRLLNRTLYDTENPKTCSRCDEIKPASEYYKKGISGRPGVFRLESACIECFRSRAAEIRERNRA